ncbi:hypothetical protein [Chryseolinea lacunae]|uniref:Lipoprotein n=1 Tax=Chryseolinea lacunae TaxID=2801331 RepID=A0ABS1KKE0_9BACT|nr:hypothetical protein [Chryseolinea lacunae]MBL0739723.1 hypothetical protein [Chryseolinea lacunae]
MRIALLLLGLLAFACDNKKCDPSPAGEACGVANPVENLVWLRDRITELKTNNAELAKYFYVQQSTYQGQTVFIFGNCCPFCDSIFLVRDCAGNTLDIASGSVDGATTVIWKAENSLCTFP